MAADDVVWVPVLPSLRGFASELGKGTKTAGEKAGKEAGDAIASGIASAQSKVDKATTKLAAAQDKVADAAGKRSVAEARLQELTDKGITSGSRYVSAVENLEKAQRGETRALQNVDTASSDLARSQSALTESTNATTASVDDLGESSLITGDNLKKFGAMAAAGATVAAGALFKVGSDFADMTNTIRVGTGASGDALEELNQVALDLGSQVPASFDDIGTTVADLNTRLGLTGQPLETMSRQFLELSKMGIDADINDVSAAFSAFGVENEDMSAGLDELFQVSQATGVSVNDLATAASKGGPALREFGFGLGESAALAGTLDKAGLDTASTFGAMQRAMVNFAKDGKSGEEALTGTVSQIEEFIAAGDQAGAIDLAGSVFGTRGAAQFVDAVKMGTLSVDDFVSATGATSDTIIGVADETRTFSDQWKMFTNDVLVKLEPLATQVFGVITDAMKWIADYGVPAIEQFAHWVGENGPLLQDLGVAAGLVVVGLTAMVVQQKAAAAGGFLNFIRSAITSTNLWAAAQRVLNIVMKANPIGVVIGLLTALAGGLVIAYRNSETFRNIVQGAMEAVGGAVSWLVDNIVKPYFGFWMDRLRDVGGVATWLYDNAIRPAMDGIGSAIETGVSIGNTALDALKSAMGAVGDFFGSVGSTISGVWDNIVIGIKRAVGNIGRILQRIQIPDWVPGVGGKGTKDLGDSLVSWAAPYRDGGPVRGAGGPRDDAILARLSNGEFVEPAHAVTPETLPLLEAIRGGWVPSPEFLHGMLPGYADGGLVSADELVDFARGVEGAEYEWGGVNWGDCSGAVSALANKATGRDPFGSRFATGNMQESLDAMGALPGVGPAGSLSFGWYNGGPYGGHTAATLPDGTHFEMGGARGDGQFGGQAVGADWGEFTDHAHFPPEYFIGGDAMPDGVVGGAASGTGGAAGLGGTFDAPTPSGGGASSGISAGMSGAGTSSGVSTSSGASSSPAQDFESFLYQLPDQIARETLGDTADFFGFGELAGLAFDAFDSSSSALGAEPATPTETDGAEGGGADGGGGGPLVWIENLITNNPEEAAAEMHREARRLVRSDALSGGW